MVSSVPHPPFMGYRIQARPLSPNSGLPSAPRSPKAVLRQLKYRPGTSVLCVGLGIFVIWLSSVLLKKLSPYRTLDIYELENEMREMMPASKNGVPGYRHLIMVPGHSIYMGSRLDALAVQNESNWALATYQVQNHQLSSYLKHIEEGVRALNKFPDALLVFSGGQTNQMAGPRSEAASYLMVADAMQYYGLDTSKLRGRILLEEYSRDSYENLLFSICRFRELAGSYPEQITIFGLAFKRKRFEELHRLAIRFPPSKFKYVGISNDDNIKPVAAGPDALSPQEGELLHSFAPYQQDLYGCSGSLHKKRISRNVYKNWHGIFGYREVCPEIRDLFTYCGNGVTIYGGQLPWDRYAH